MRKPRRTEEPQPLLRLRAREQRLIEEVDDVPELPHAVAPRAALDHRERTRRARKPLHLRLLGEPFELRPRREAARSRSVRAGVGDPEAVANHNIAGREGGRSMGRMPAGARRGLRGRDVDELPRRRSSKMTDGGPVAEHRAGPQASSAAISTPKGAAEDAQLVDAAVAAHQPSIAHVPGDRATGRAGAPSCAQVTIPCWRRERGDPPPRHRVASRAEVRRAQRTRRADAGVAIGPAVRA